MGRSKADSRHYRSSPGWCNTKHKRKEKRRRRQSASTQKRLQTLAGMKEQILKELKEEGIDILELDVTTKNGVLIKAEYDDTRTS